MRIAVPKETAPGERRVALVPESCKKLITAGYEIGTMDEINPEMPQCDVALVVGANDVVNPAARSEKSSPIYGMPIIEADKARTVIAIKRSKSPGFAGIENDLYFGDHTWMLFGDAKEVVGELARLLAASSNASRTQAA